MDQVYVITGSSKLPRPLHPRVRAELAHLPDPPTGTAWYITGGQYGVDLVAFDELLERYPWAYHELWLPAKKHATHELADIIQARRPTVAADGGRLRVHQCLPGTDYRYRNLCMLQQAYHLEQRGASVKVEAWPLYPESAAGSKRSGTWLCKRQAEQAGFPVRVHPLWL